MEKSWCLAGELARREPGGARGAASKLAGETDIFHRIKPTARTQKPRCRKSLRISAVPFFAEVSRMRSKILTVAIVVLLPLVENSAGDPQPKSFDLPAGQSHYVLVEFPAQHKA